MLHFYEKLSSFFKNLAESNHMEFKEYLSQFVPKTKDEEWNKENKTVTEIFNMQFLHLMKTSRISQNSDPVMIHSD